MVWYRFRNVFVGFARCFQRGTELFSLCRCRQGRFVHDGSCRVGQLRQLLVGRADSCQAAAVDERAGSGATGKARKNELTGEWRAAGVAEISLN